MLSYVIRRCFYMIIILLAVSVVSFIIIQLPPGDYLTNLVESLKAKGVQVSEEQVLSLQRQYGLGLPLYIQYFKWMWNMLHGNLGHSFQWNRPVSELIAERLPLTVIISILTMIFAYAVAIPVGIYSATHQYSIADYSFTVIGFMGLAIPNFLLALILMFIFYKYFGLHVGGLFSTEYQTAPWSVAKFLDMLKHLPIPIIVIGTAGTAGAIRVMRGCLLDELHQQYVITARAKGVSERQLLFKYPVRVAINPMVSTLGWTLPYIVSGETITSIVLSLPTTGPLLFGALISQDMYLAGSIIMLLTFLTVIGTLISDLLLAWVDPRIRYGKEGTQ
ncbi:ABC transporter permease [Candidatus Aerophobetes bacterium]|uniref:ABC transporter permease n=1 Tax=Aerophobetes bacterium TaxID=2030807 RepID=A0A497E1V6_UNCAE|nr:MAG: ABC transporter permease [Candidatus Aerophobetes bacterium]